MRTKYECEFCGELFESSLRCRIHESSHFSGVEEQIKYNLIHSHEEYICDYCDNCYYVYWCEQDCKFKDCNFKNKFKDFKLKEIK